VVLRRWLGLEIELVPEGREDWRLDLPNGAALLLPDLLLALPEDRWLRPESLPEPRTHRLQGTPFEGLTLDGDLAALFGEGPSLTEAEGATRLNLDVLGTAFFLLSRYEEHVFPERDALGRFPFQRSLLSRAGLVTRPLADEHAAILAATLRRLWPEAPFRETAYAAAPTHDMDWPWAGYGVPLPMAFAKAGADLLRRKSPGLALRRLRAALFRRAKGDPYDTFDWLLEQSERRGLKSAFYFIPRGQPSRINGYYRIDDPGMKALMTRAAGRGHEVGLHPSFGSQKDAAGIAEEFAILKGVAENSGVRQSAWGGRHHYLCWEPSVTWEAWEAAGLTYDSTLGFAEHPGFRCGTSRPYHAFSLHGDRALALEERPLILMENSILEAGYLGLDETGAKALGRRLVAQCRRHGGRFTFLWHNSSLASARERALYLDLLQAAAG
jgi:hypothetical protein